jgi:adenylylsulfate kinase-like enzyme
LTDVLVIAGPAGVGKTCTANEVSQQLRAAGVAHAVVDTDALDDVYRYRLSSGGSPSATSPLCGGHTPSWASTG